MALVEGARAAEDVVGGAIGAVEADADAGDAAIFDFARHRRIDQRAVGGEGDDQAGIRRMAGDVEDVRAEERLAAGERRRWGARRPRSDRSDEKLRRY